MSAATLDHKYAHAQDIIRSFDRVAVAFSGGVDSTFVLKAAVDVLGPDRVLAVTGNSPSLARAELDQARTLAEHIGAEQVVIDTTEFADENYLTNPANRCYFCKTSLYSAMETLIRRRGLKVVVNGINADDQADWRPGIQAAREFAVRSPAAEAQLTKSEIRELSRRLGLPTSDKPAGPCLSSRVQYGERITPDKLLMIERCEAFLHELGLTECRVRHHDKLARIEVPPEQVAQLATPDIRRRIVETFQAAGYSYITLDLQGFRSGSMNEVIAFGVVQPTL